MRHSPSTVQHRRSDVGLSDDLIPHTSGVPCQRRPGQLLSFLDRGSYRESPCQPASSPSAGSYAWPKRIG